MKIGMIWDLDGTLLDTLEDLTDSVNYTLARYDLPARTPEEVRRFVGNGARQLMTLALPGLPSDPDVSEALAVFQAYYRDHSQVKTRPYAGVPDVLGKLKERYPMAVVSNKPDGAVRVLCRRNFPGLYAVGERADCPRKPAPDMVRKAMKELNVDSCVYIGDSEVDVLTAKNAGVPCLSVLWGFRDRQTLAAAGAAYFCERPEHLPEILEKIIGEVYGQ